MLNSDFSLDKCVGSKLRVVTGQVIHSKGKGARIRPAVVNYLQEKNTKLCESLNIVCRLCMVVLVKAKIQIIDMTRRILEFLV